MKPGAFQHHPGELSANVVRFCRLLRAHGVLVGAGEQQDALRALARIDLSLREQFRLALRISLTKNPQEQQIFDRLFPAYWSGESETDQHMGPGQAAEPDPRVHRLPEGEAHQPSLSEWSAPEDALDTEPEATASYSPLEVLGHRDFSQFQADELPAVRAAIQQIARLLAQDLNRRYQQVRHGGRVDLRRTIRYSLRRGGEVVDLALRRRRFQRLRLVLLCDVSRSMDLYSQFFIQFIYAFQHQYRSIETFVFSTRLHRVSELLRRGPLEKALEELPRRVPDWSGGTKIGQSLHRFLQDFGPRYLSRQTVVLIISDGWDTGDLALLAESMARLQQNSTCLIWLNPLMGFADYQPTCRGMQTALPYIDVFAPGHNLHSLHQLARQLLHIRLYGFRRHRYPVVYRTPEPEERLE